MAGEHFDNPVCVVEDFLDVIDGDVRGGSFESGVVAQYAKVISCVGRLFCERLREYDALMCGDSSTETFLEKMRLMDHTVNFSILDI